MNLAAGTQHWRHVRRGLHAAAVGWLYDPNVTFIDYGYRETGGELLLDEPPCIRVHVVEKFVGGAPAVEAATRQGLTRGYIPDDFEGIPVDRPQGSYQLKWRRRRRPQWPAGRIGSSTGSVSPRRSRVDPLRGGISVSDAFRPISGTLGSPVLDRATGQPMIISNWHVISGARGWPGMPILQPGRGDGGTWGDQVGTFARHAMASNLDAAVVELGAGREAVNEPWGLSPVTGAELAQLGMEVVKSGRTTGVTRGIVTGVEGSQRAYYAGIGFQTIRKVMCITPGDPELSLPGDSGCLWIEEKTMRAVGLHFAGNRSGQPEEALAMDIGPVLDTLEVDLHV
ncbi:MAG: hypothetical protein GY926_21300 [bacterium]|nr:hypothetical protein [bacterium]